MAVEDATEVYLRYARANEGKSQRTAPHERHRRRLYPRILHADRVLREQYSGLTTVMISRRLQPKDQNGEWLPPSLLSRSLHTPHVMRRAREVVRYHLREFDYSYVRVTAPTESAATPHEHRYFWVDDPENRITVDKFRPVIEEHLQHVPNADEDHHPIEESGRSGAITVRHAPPLVDEDPVEADAIHREWTELFAADDSAPLNTRGAQYLASQLAHMPLWDQFDSDKDNPPRPLIEGGMIARATPSQWFGASNDLPNLCER
jgi:hypothetical protein